MLRIWTPPEAPEKRPTPRPMLGRETRFAAGRNGPAGLSAERRARAVMRSESLASSSSGILHQGISSLCMFAWKRRRSQSQAVQACITEARSI